jgi:hypothetical protein
MEVAPGTSDTCLFSIYQKSKLYPKYSEIMNGIDVKISFELEDDYSMYLVFF